MSELNSTLDNVSAHSDSTGQTVPLGIPTLSPAEGLSGSAESFSVADSLNLRAASRVGNTPHTEASESSRTLLQKTSAINVSVSEKSMPCHKGRSNIFSSWRQESFGCLMSLVALLAMCVTLTVYRHKPSPDWPTWLSLNTIVAIYSVVLKAGILFVAAEGLGQVKWSWISQERPLIDLVRYDEATRGPEGAFRLLWRLRHHHLTASCGALLAILALAVDPLAQQMLRYYDCTISLSGELATLPRTNFFYDYNLSYVGSEPSAPSAGVQASLLAGMMGAGNSMHFKCPTGNCTWPQTYSTFGYCSTCQDISHLLSIRNVTSNSSYLGWAIETSLPDGGLAVKSPHWDYVQAKIGSAPIAITHGQKLIVDFVRAKQYDLYAENPMICPSGSECDVTGSDSDWKRRGYGAARCHISPCVKTYSASVEKGILSETLLDSTDHWGYSPLAQYAMIDTHCVTHEEKRSLEDSGYTVMQGERWLPYNLTIHVVQASVPGNLGHGFVESISRRNCIYFYDYQLDTSIYLWTVYGRHALFHGTVYGSLGENDFEGSVIAKAFYQFGNVEFDHVQDLFQNITDSMTTYMRQTAHSAFSEPAQGHVEQSKTCVDVRWPWIAFPAALLLIASGFLFLLAIETRTGSNGPAIWKSSPLALLYHGFATPTDTVGDKSNGRPDLCSIRGMEESAKRTTVQLKASGYHRGTFLQVKDQVERT